MITATMKGMSRAKVEIVSVVLRVVEMYCINRLVRC
jgi:hypothetical protein